MCGPIVLDVNGDDPVDIVMAALSAALLRSIARGDVDALGVDRIFRDTEIIIGQMEGQQNLSINVNGELNPREAGTNGASQEA